MEITTAGPETTAPRLRAATGADVAALADLVNSAYRGERARRGWTSEADLLGGQRVDVDGITEILATPDTMVLVAAHDAELIACCELRRVEEGAYFGMFSVRPDRQGAGVGDRVLREAERIATGWGCARMRMTVITQRGELIAWYERRGYRRTGETSPFPYGDERFGVPKRPDLRFDVLVKELIGTR